MLRSAAKNHEAVTVVTDPADYAEVADQVLAGGQTTLELRRRLAAKVYARTAAYDAAIAAQLPRFFASDAGEPAPARAPMALIIQAPLVQTLRYGENPHQAPACMESSGTIIQQLHGKELPTTTS
jgi:phosphoribosylaminoimidazolecarboxamide formyltransferase/IMP cyclohydrolase